MPQKTDRSDRRPHRISAAGVCLALAMLSLLAQAGRAQDPGDLARHLTFETDHPGGAPAGWSINPPGSVTADDKVVRGGKWSARIVRTADAAGAFSGITKTIPLDAAGKTIVLRAHLRTEDVTGFVALWLRQDGASPNLAFDTTQAREVKGTNDWHEHSATVPIRPEGRRLVFGVLLSGTGTAWVDDVELLVDGKPIQDAPKVERPLTALDKDREFDSGSRVTVDELTAAQIDNLTTLGLVWGFLKYHHPAVVSGSRHWDYDLFRILPGVIAAADRASGNAAISKWIAGLGTVEPCSACASSGSDNVHFPPDLAWIRDESRLGADLSRQLVTVHTNRPAGGRQCFVSLAPGVGNPVFQNEPAYEGVRLPDAGFQLLALYRWWNIVQYWFPYRDVIGEPWENVLREFIPKVATSKTKPEYERELMAAIARVHDTHANLWSSLASRPPAGACQLPIALRFIGDEAVVTSGDGDFERGDVVVSIDGQPVSKLVSEWSPYYAASNEPTRLRDIARSMTRGACGEGTVGVRRGERTLTLTATRVPPPPKPAPPTHDLPGETFRKLSNDVAYLKLSTIALADVPGYVDAAAGTKGLVVDIRNYPSAFVVFALGQRFVTEPTPFARFTNGDLSNPGAFRWGPTLSLTPASPRYTGTLVILVDEVSQSQAEYTAMAFRAAPGARVVGSTTAGADGNVSAIPLPGSLRAMISGIGVFYPDKRPTQRIGIVPDVEVRPSIDGIRAGRDEVLEAGIREILGPGVALTEIQRMIPAAGRFP